LLPDPSSGEKPLAEPYTTAIPEWNDSGSPEGEPITKSVYPSPLKSAISSPAAAASGTPEPVTARTDVRRRAPTRADMCLSGRDCMLSLPIHLI
jgi:hypothetical protein